MKCHALKKWFYEKKVGKSNTQHKKNEYYLKGLNDQQKSKSISLACMFHN